MSLFSFVGRVLLDFLWNLIPGDDESQLINLLACAACKKGLIAKVEHHSSEASRLIWHDIQCLGNQVAL